MAFEVSPDVLIPRPETELLVMRLLDIAKNRGNEQPIAIADVGTGSGIIAVVVAKRLPHVRVAAIDQSRKALAIARRNSETHAVSERIEWIESNLFEAVPADRKFDIIASNPPYISEQEYQALSKTVKDFEPYNALVAGPRGTEVIERLVPAAAERLNTGGWLLLEVSPMIEPAVRQLLEADSRFELLPTVKDLAGQPRVAQAKRRP
jgi:release factor glutamine methyltransferase